MRLRVCGGQPVSGEATVPPDKSILHRALLLAALGEGPARIRPLGRGADNRSTRTALEALGVKIEAEMDAAVVHGVGGPSGFLAPAGPIDCGNSGTTMRLLAGVVAAGRGLDIVLDGDASLRRRPMERLLPLEAMGATLSAERPGPLLAPLRVRGAALKGGTFVLPVASAQVKSALLLAGLWAEGPTVVIEPRTSRDHTERALRARGIEVAETTLPDGSHRVEVAPLDRAYTNVDAEVPPDPSAAAFLWAAAVVTGGAVAVRAGVNPTRTGALDVFRSLGAGIEVGPTVLEHGEPVAVVRAKSSALHGTRVDGELSLRALDELPVLAGVGLFAEGETVIADAAELKVKESDRILDLCRLLAAFGGAVEPRADGLIVTGGQPLRPAEVHAAQDHRLAMTAAVIGLGIVGPTIIHGAEVIDVSFPCFVPELQRLGADIGWV